MVGRAQRERQPALLGACKRPHMPKAPDIMLRILDRSKGQLTDSLIADLYLWSIGL